MQVLRRLLTFIIDNILLVVVGAVIISKMARLYGLSFDYKRGIEELVRLFHILIAWLNHALMESSAKQATLGKMAIGIVVTGLNGNRISFDRATIGHFGKIIERLDSQTKEKREKINNSK